MSLPTRVLGRTGLRVTVLGYGALELRNPPHGREVSEQEAERILNAVLDSGVNLIDTAPDYGMSEERIGRHLSRRRDEYVLATKCGCVIDAKAMAGVRPPHDFARANIVAAVEQSLRRLRTDRVDLLQLHASPSVDTLRREEVLETLQSLRDAGKVRFIGMSGQLPHLPDQIALGVFDAFQIPYSALEPSHEPHLLAAAESGAGVLVRGGAARGAPSGERQAVERPGHFSDGPQSSGPSLASTWDDVGFAELLGDMSPMEFTLRYTITHPGMTSAIVGTLNPKHLQANVEAVSRGPLAPDVYAEARKRLTAAGLLPQDG